MNVWFVANKILPGSDYRVQFSQFQEQIQCTYLLPGKPEQMPEQHYRKLSVFEGVGLHDFLWPFVLWYRLLLNRKQVDSAVFFSTKLILIGPLLARLAGVESIITVTGRGRVFASENWLMRTLRVLYLSLFRLSAYSAKRVMFQNRGDLGWFQENFPQLSDKAYMIGSAINFPVKKRTATIFRGKLKILCVARIMPQKGIDDFISIAQYFEKQTKDIEFVLVGPSSKGYDELLQKVKNSDESGLISYLGEVQGQALASLYGEANVFLFPSYSEGMPRVMLEAGYQGLYPIAYNIDAHRDLVLPEVAQLTKLYDRSGLIQQLEAVLQNPAQAYKKSTLYQNHILDQFGMDSYAKKMIRVLKNDCS
jgi:glycosyltransferase involved in cell wall biosynthesis